ncbi:hypothetical protein HDE_08311 [Halotydeus destructor]|nr:hypothetical protein HDE_08311 [Halotydeus destructor]
MKFRPPKYAEKAKLVIFADFYGYKVTLLTIDNFCGYYGFECPLDPGVLHTLQLKQYVSKYFWLPMPLYSQLGVKLMSRAKSGILACATFQLGFNANGHYDHDEL